MEKYELEPIGTIYTPFKKSKDTPIQPTFSKDKGRAVLFEKYLPGLKSLDGFSDIYLIYYCHRSKQFSLQVQPYLDNKEHGVFATRSPARPNPIGISIVELISIDEDTIHFRGADILDETPLLDIKPYISRFDHIEETKDGWLQDALEQEGKEKKADSRFEK